MALLCYYFRMIIESSVAIRQRYNEVINKCRETGQPIFLTKNGKGDAVVMDIQTYERIMASLELRLDLLESEYQMRQDPSHGHSAEEVLQAMRKAAGLGKI